jgi:hypothetical protein
MGFICILIKKVEFKLTAASRSSKYGTLTGKADREPSLRPVSLAIISVTLAIVPAVGFMVRHRTNGFNIAVGTGEWPVLAIRSVEAPQCFFVLEGG